MIHCCSLSNFWVNSSASVLHSQHFDFFIFLCQLHHYMMGHKWGCRVVVKLLIVYYNQCYMKGISFCYTDALSYTFCWHETPDSVLRPVNLSFEVLTLVKLLCVTLVLYIYVCVCALAHVCVSIICVYLCYYLTYFIYICSLCTSRKI